MRESPGAPVVGVRFDSTGDCGARLMLRWRAISHQRHLVKTLFKVLLMSLLLLLLSIRCQDDSPVFPD